MKIANSYEIVHVWPRTEFFLEAMHNLKKILIKENTIINYNTTQKGET